MKSITFFNSQTSGTCLVTVYEINTLWLYICALLLSLATESEEWRRTLGVTINKKEIEENIWNHRYKRSNANLKLIYFLSIMRNNQFESLAFSGCKQTYISDPMKKIMLYCSYLVRSCGPQSSALLKPNYMFDLKLEMHWNKYCLLKLISSHIT
jgi:hypothetical protein